MKDIAVRLTDNLYLLCRLVQAAAKVAVKPKPVHHLWILDGSGSMGWTMRDALRDLKLKADTLRDGDYLSFAFFSSRNDWSYPIKGFHVTPESREALKRLFDNLRPPYNLTNFSEVLDEAANVIDGLQFLGVKHVLWFLSDGMANDPGVAREHEATEKILREKLASRLTTMMTVSYGDYADRAFLARMATICGGETIQSSQLQEFSQALARFIESAQEFEPRVSVQAPVNTVAAFAVVNGGVVSFETDMDGCVSFPPTGGDSYIYFLLDRAPSVPKPAASMFLDDLELAFGYPKVATPENMRNVVGGLAAAVVLSQMERRDEALEVLGHVGDVRLIDGFANAFTNAEIGNAENAVVEVIADPAAHLFRDGWKANYVPRRDAFCLLDALDILLGDPTARFHSRHPEFRYKRIGRKSEVREGYPAFVPEAGTSSPLDALVWHKSLLNMSVRAKLRGTVELPESVVVPADAPPADTPSKSVAEMAASIGSAITGGVAPEPEVEKLARPASLPEIMETFQWRTYTLVKDAFLNVTRLPVSCSHETFHVLQLEGLVDGEDEWEQDRIYVLKLDSIPIINRAMADTGRSAAAMCRHQYAAIRLEADAKTFRFLRDELDPDKEIVQRTPWAVEELRFLRAAGFRDDGSFSPPIDEEPKTDQYEVNRFTIKVKGLSSLPSIPDVRARVAAPVKGKAGGLTVSQLLIADALNRYSTALNARDVWDIIPDGTDPAARFSEPEIKRRLAWLDERLAEIKRDLAFHRNHVQRPKFVVALTHTWFEEAEMSPRKPEGNKLVVDDIEFTVVVDKEVIHI